MFVDGKQQHARQIRIVGRLGFWWGDVYYPRTILSRWPNNTHTTE